MDNRKLVRLTIVPDDPARWLISWLGFGTMTYLHLLGFTALVMDDSLDAMDTTGRTGMRRSRFDFLE